MLLIIDAPVHDYARPHCKVIERMGFPALKLSLPGRRATNGSIITLTIEQLITLQ